MGFLNFSLPSVTDPEKERTSRECAAYISASRLQFKHYSSFKLIVQIIQTFTVIETVIDRYLAVET